MNKVSLINKQDFFHEKSHLEKPANEKIRRQARDHITFNL